MLGTRGRDEATADRLEGHKLFVLGTWQNPGLVEKAIASGGQFVPIDSITNVDVIADIVQDIKPDMFLTNLENSLEAGVVDVIKDRVAGKLMPDLFIPCPDRETARVEWDKFYLRQIIDEIDPSYNPVNFMAESANAVNEAFAYFESIGMEVAVKPRNLCGGKGVKVMGKHFNSYADAKKYAQQVLLSPDQSGVEIQEKLVGHEFTLQLFTDGTTLVKPPATYDYPYREDGDQGPGIGGMGSFTMQAGKQLPFLTAEDYTVAVDLMEKVLVKLKERGHDYKGVLYPTFFKTAKGLKIVEINARGGDPELINILDLMEDDVDFFSVLKQIAVGELATDSVRYKKLASAMLYLVAPEYGYKEGPVHRFTMDLDTIEEHDCRVRFSAAECLGGHEYATTGSSRTVGLSALGKTPWEARGKIHQAIAAGFGRPLALQYRNQIAQEHYIHSLKLP